MDYFSVLSISTLASDNEDSEDFSYDPVSRSRMELDKRLKELEDITTSFLVDAPVQLLRERSAFAEVERTGKLEFELKIDHVKAEDVLCLSVKYLPESSNDARSGDSISYQPLHISLERIGGVNSSNTTTSYVEPSFKPKLFGDEYTFALTKGHGLAAGSYRLSVENLVGGSLPQDTLKAYQPIRVHYAMRQVTRGAIPLESNQTVIGRISPNEFVYYRFVRKSAKDDIEIRLKISSSNNSVSGEGTSALSSSLSSDSIDADLYVTNMYDGLVGTTQDEFVWRDVGTGSSRRLVIHPEDPESGRGNFFLIGVYGNNATFDTLGRVEFALCITSPKQPTVSVVDIKLGEAVTKQVASGHSSVSSITTLSYFTLKVSDFDVVADATIAVRVGLTANSRSSDSDSGSDRFMTSRAVVTSVSEAEHVLQHPGFGIYTTDSVSGVPSPPYSTSLIPSAASAKEKDYSSSGSRAVRVFFSDVYRYPDEEYYSWRASCPVDGSALALIDVKELRSRHPRLSGSSAHSRGIRGVVGHDALVYFSVGIFEEIVSKYTALTVSASVVPKDILLGSHQQPSARNQTILLSRVFHRIFADIDGASVSLTERHHRQALQAGGWSRGGKANLDLSQSLVWTSGDEGASLTYGEIDFEGFVSILHAANITDGQVFYDLGCGAGKAIVAATFSGIRFLKCVGVEILPGLAQCATKAAGRVREAVMQSAGLQAHASSGVFGRGVGVDMGRNLPSAATAAAIGGVAGPGTVVDRAKHMPQSAEEREALAALETGMPLIEIREKSFTDEDCDWSDADAVFLSSICFSDSLLQGFMNGAHRLRPGATVLTLKLPVGYEDMFVLWKSLYFKFSWGRAKVFFLSKKKSH